ncbi:hypothetical protein Ciccas_013954, partial [Cichlidogyrus casuarinus]
VIYGSNVGFHAIDLDDNSTYDIYLANAATQGHVVPHCIVVLPGTRGQQLLLCYNMEGVYVDTQGRVTKNVMIQWGEVPTTVQYTSKERLLGWGKRAIEVRNAKTGQLDGVYNHAKQDHRFKFLCEKNDKVFFCNSKNGNWQVSMMSLSGINW